MTTRASLLCTSTASLDWNRVSGVLDPGNGLLEITAAI